jgi:hypothetical protein|tara:strand:+ start:550 stop:981 length:432 start_codon:yes stop_codon:yes gene_type:complete
MASSIKYPDSSASWYIEGDKFALITNVDSSGSGRTTVRKEWRAIAESVTDGLLLHYYGEPNKVRTINDEIDLDNSLHLSLVDYIKYRLYLDKAGVSPDAGISQSAMVVSMNHEKKFKDAVSRYGIRKRDKTGGTRAIVPSNFT